MIEVSHVSRQYELSKKQKAELQTTAGSLAAVNDVSFVCQPGRIFSLLGPNGAGKTTTLRMIATLLRPTSGNIRVNGLDVVADATAVRREIGFLTGSTNLYDRLTPAETVKYFADLYGLPDAVFKERKEKLFTQLGIHDFVNKRVGQLSTGMKQRVSIARTMIHDPAVVIFDEPTSGLDVISAGGIIDLIRDCKAVGKTVIFSSHIMSEVEKLCDVIGIIHQGRLLAEGSLAQLRLRYGETDLEEIFVRAVGGEPPLLGGVPA